MSKALSLLAVLLLPLLAWQGDAAAADTTIAILGIEPAAGAPDAVATAITDALRQRAASSSGYRLVQGKDLVEVKLVFSCPDEAPTCMTQAAQSIGTTKMIFGNVQPVGTEAFLVTVKLLDAERGVVESWVSEQVTKAQTSGPALRAPVQKWFATLTGQSMPGTVKLSGGVTGAQVAIDGLQTGMLGADGLTMAGVAPGPHRLVITKPGYEKFERTFTLASGGLERIVVQMPTAALPEGEAAPGLVPPPAGKPAAAVDTEQPPLPSPTDYHRNSRVAAWAVLGVGVAAVGFGAFSSWKVGDINSSLDPYRRFTCLSGPQKGQVLCDSTGAPQQPLDDAEVKWTKSQLDLGNTYQTLQWVGYGVGAAALVTSGFLFYRGYFNEPTTSAKSESTTWALFPSLYPGSAGATAIVRY